MKGLAILSLALLAVGASAVFTTNPGPGSSAIPKYAVSTEVWPSVSQALNRTIPLSVLRATVDWLGWTAEFNRRDPVYTLFAPTDAAFAAFFAEFGINPTTLFRDAGNKPVVANILLYHVVPYINYTVEGYPLGTTTFATTRAPHESLTGGIEIFRTFESMDVIATGNQAKVVVANMKAGNAIIHQVDKVLYNFYPSIYAALEDNPSLFSSLKAAVDACNLTATLSNVNASMTVYAPTNKAISATAAIFGWNPASMLQDTGVLTSILAYHSLAGVYPMANFINGTDQKSLYAGQPWQAVYPDSHYNLRIFPKSGVASDVIMADVPIGPGPRSLIQVVDQMIIPEVASVRVAMQQVIPPNYPPGVLSTLLDLIDTDGAFAQAISDPKFVGTIFAPLNSAWVRLFESPSSAWKNLTQLKADKVNLNKILRAHVVVGSVIKGSELRDGMKLETLFGNDGTTLTVERRSVPPQEVVFKILAKQSFAKPKYTDIMVNYGRAVIHLVDFPLIPDLTTITNGIANQPSLSYLSLLLSMPEVAPHVTWAQFLSNKDLEYTIFAPTDRAFDAFLQKWGWTRAQLQYSEKVLINLLNMHIVPSKAWYADDVPVGKTPVTNAAGVTLSLQSSDSETGGGLLVQGPLSYAHVSTPDVRGGNSVIHIIDTVLYSSNTAPWSG